MFTLMSTQNHAYISCQKDTIWYEKNTQSSVSFTCVCVCVCVCVRARARAGACMRACVCACVCVCVRACVRVRVFEQVVFVVMDLFAICICKTILSTCIIYYTSSVLFVYCVHVNFKINFTLKDKINLYLLILFFKYFI